MTIPPFRSLLLLATEKCPVRRQKTGDAYFFPLDDSMVGKEIEVVLLGMKDGGKDLTPSVWLTAWELPFQASLAK
ncbi:MAG: hypothetical protein QMC24_06370 [Akkermansiaceae bacterium]